MDPQTQSLITFAFGFVLLLLFAAYVITGSERAKRILGTILTVFIVGLCLGYVYPPIDVPTIDPATGKTLIDEKTGKEVIKEKYDTILSTDALVKSVSKKMRS